VPETPAPIRPLPDVDLVLTGARVIDPGSGTDAVLDVALAGDTIAAVGRDLRVEHPLAATTSLEGAILTPGLMDLHCHVFAGLGDFCVEPDRAGVSTGVPVVIDGGTSGVATFELARRFIEGARPATRVLAFIDPNQLYLATKDFICHKLRIADDERNLDLDSTAEMVERNADMIIGFKVRATHVGDDTRSPFLEGAKSIAGDLPIMVHLGRFPHTPVITSEALLRSLRGGDIITHAFRGGGGQLVPGTGTPTPEFAEAVERGVRLDVGHSGTDFRFDTARRLFDAGYLPDTISTDLNLFNEAAPVRSLAETMSKIWAMGVELADVIAMCTSNTATSIRRSDELGAIAPGRVAELSVLRIEEGAFELSDGYEPMRVDRVLTPVGCFRAGIWIDAATPRAPRVEAA